ncbi:CoA transferase [Nocardia rosealba]|uniref:CoA transferase n=1 Tax=Nocardia rosealba TaxID=2878563 RepID=UPI001CDA301E|nr:CoA transferase [Nocardia rosealba]MCA2207792.1 CoA transferase [Nocardia rosealba]
MSRHSLRRSVTGAPTPDEVVNAWLRTLTDSVPAEFPGAVECPALGWASSGAMALTGHPEAAPDLSPAPAFTLLGAALRALSWVTGEIGSRVDLEPGAVLTARAEEGGLRRAGRRSAGGASRLVRMADGWCALTLGRRDDIEAVPALLGRVFEGDAWVAIEAAAAGFGSRVLAERARLLGIPAAALPDRDARLRRTPLPWKVSRIAAPVTDRSLRGLVVVDLTSMWAGPLCGRILGAAGAHVIKVESPHRPDGARANPGFFVWLHAGQEFRTVDFRTSAGRTALARLLDSADVVLEASRPRALAQLGLAPEDRTHRDGQIWLSLTGYGRSEPLRVAFGDDAAVAGGLVGRHHGDPVFCADAIADPLSGVCAALAVASARRSGGGVLIDLSMRDTAAAFATAPPLTHGPHTVRYHDSTWVVECPLAQGHHPVREPEPRSPWCTPCPADTQGTNAARTNPRDIDDANAHAHSTNAPGTNPHSTNAASTNRHSTSALSTDPHSIDDTGSNPHSGMASA